MRVLERRAKTARAAAAAAGAAPAAADATHRAIIRAEDAARGPGRAAAREHRVGRAAARRRARRTRGYGQARRAEIQQATEAVRARAAPREPQPSQSFTSLVGDFLRPMVAAVADDAAPDEPAVGWMWPVSVAWRALVRGGQRAARAPARDREEPRRAPGRRRAQLAARSRPRCDGTARVSRPTRTSGRASSPRAITIRGGNGDRR